MCEDQRESTLISDYSPPNTPIVGGGVAAEGCAEG